MTAVKFFEGETAREGYLALPAGGKGNGVLVLHAWWGLNEFFKGLCDRLAAQGLVAFAPDLNDRQIARTVDEANRLSEARNFREAQGTADAALHFLQKHPAVTGGKVSAVGFSMGAAYILLLNEKHPDLFDKLVLFYGPSELDVSGIEARIQFHFAENDEWEPLEGVKKIQAPDAEMHIYPGVGHWFFESDRPDAFDPPAAELAWQRMVSFLNS